MQHEITQVNENHSRQGSITPKLSQINHYSIKKWKKNERELRDFESKCVIADVASNSQQVNIKLA